MKRSIALDEKRPIWASLALFLIPLMLSNILQALGSTASAAFLGRLLGPRSLAAAANLFPIIFFLISFLIGLASASSVLIGQAFGAGDRDRVKTIAGSTLGLGVGLGILLGIAGAVFAEPLLRLIGTPPDIYSLSLEYARITFLSLPLLFAYIVYTTFLRGTGDAKTPFFFLIGSTVISIATTPALILGWFGLPHLGVAAAAWSAIIANAITLAALIVYLDRTKSVLAFDERIVRALIPRGQIVVDLVRIGIPTGIQLIMVSLSEIALISLVNRFGSHATAAYGAVNQIVSYVQFPAISIGIAASIFGAQSIGALRPDRLRAIVRASVLLNYAIGGTLIIACYIFSDQILSLFFSDPSARATAHRLLMITLWSYVLFGNSAVLSGVMRSSGTVLWPTLISIFSIWAIEVPTAYALARTDLGLTGVWYGYPAAFAVSVTLQYAYYRFVWRKTLPTPIAASPSAAPSLPS